MTASPPPASNHVTWLAEKSDQIASQLERNWITQGIASAVAVLYLSSPSLAESLARNLKVEPTLVQLGFPFVATYLLIRMGYLLYGYLQVRSALMDELQAQQDEPPTANQPHRLVTRSHSLFWIWAMILDRREFRGRYTAPKIHEVAGQVVPFVFLAALVVGVSAFNNGVTTYLSYSLRRPLGTPLEWFFWGLAVFLITTFYWQFLMHMGSHTRGAAWAVAITYASSAGIGIALVLADPLASLNRLQVLSAR